MEGHLTISWLLVLTQAGLVMPHDLPRGLIRASEVYILPWTPKTPQPVERSHCIWSLKCREGDEIRNATIQDISGPMGPPGEVGQMGDAGYPGEVGSEGPSYVGCGVAFSLALESNRHGPRGLGSLIVFDKVITNIGNAISERSGQFTAPYNGVFQFQVTVSAKGSRKAAVNLFWNEDIKGTIWADSTRGTKSASNNYIFEMKKDDKVYLKKMEALYLTDKFYMSFTGKCLWEN